MSDSHVHTILSEVHRLLGQYSAGDFVAASRYPGLSGGIRSILLCLAGETEPQQPQSSHDARNRSELQRNRNSKTRKSSRQPVSGDGILETILKSPRLTSPRGILDFASAHGLNIRSKPKDGRDRLARRLAAAIESAPDSVRSTLLAALDWKAGSQTQGWLDVIKGSRP